MSKQIITISREFGSGGRSVGHRVAELLGVPYYDKELVKQVSVETRLKQSFCDKGLKKQRNSSGGLGREVLAPPLARAFPS